MAKLDKRLKRKKRLAEKKTRVDRLAQQYGVISAPREGLSLMKRMSGRHPDVLQNIEFALVKSHKEDRSVDDSIVYAALRCEFSDTDSQDDRVRAVLGFLDGMRDFRQDVDDGVWHDCLRVVMDSVRNHSDLRPGSLGYLRFVSQFVV